MVMAALPALKSSRIKKLKWTVESDHRRAYVAILEAESHVLRILAKASALRLAKHPNPAVKEAEEQLVSVRVAGHLFLEFETRSSFFGTTPSTVLAKWFISPPENTQNNQHDVVIETGTCLRDNFIKLFQTQNAQYSPPSSRLSNSFFDTLEDMIKDLTEPAGDDYSVSRQKALARDDYRCAVTGVHNKVSLGCCQGSECPSEPGVKATRIQVAHIFNEAAMQDVAAAVDRGTTDFAEYKTYRAASALTMLGLFGFSELVDAFKKTGGVHQVWNLISLDCRVRDLFDHLELWFEHTREPHHYKVCVSDKNDKKFIASLYEGHDRSRSPMFVEFNTKYEGAPPPDPILLALHAACARVAHISGAAEFFDRAERDAEETKVLAVDGSSGPLLTHLLPSFAAIPGVA